MSGDDVGGVAAQIAPGEAFEEGGEFPARLRGKPGGHRRLRRGIAGARKALFVETARQVIRGRGVKLPEHFRLPRRQRLRINGLDVCVSQERQHFQPLRRFDLLGKFANRFKGENVPALNRARHFQVFGNQEADGFSFLGSQSQPFEDSINGGEAALDVVRRGHAFADVVEEQAQHQKLGLLELGKYFTKLWFPSGGARARRRRRACFTRQAPPPTPQPSEILDGPQRVLVHGIAVVKVAKHQRVHGAKLRENVVEEAEAMHGAQGAGSFGGGKNFSEILPQRLGVWRLAAVQLRHGLLYTTFGFAPELQSVPRHQLKGAKKRVEAREFGLPGIDLAAHYGELGRRKARLRVPIKAE